MTTYREIIHIGAIPRQTQLPEKLNAFIWYFISQIKGILLLLVMLEGLAGFFLAMIPVMLGWLVNDITTLSNPELVLQQPWLITIGVPVILGWGLSGVALWYLYDHHYNSRFGNFIRYQLGHYTLGQSLAYFQNDFAGRIANKVIEGGPTLRDPTRSAIGAVLYAGVFTATCISIMSANNLWLAAPAACWLAIYIWSLVHFVPQVKALGLIHSRQHTKLVGHVNDTYTNILSVKLFAREDYEDARKLEILQQHATTMRNTSHKMWQMGTVHMAINVAMMLATPAVALWL